MNKMFHKNVWYEYERTCLTEMWDLMALQPCQSISVAFSHSLFTSISLPTFSACAQMKGYKANVVSFEESFERLCKKFRCAKKYNIILLLIFNIYFHFHRISLVFLKTSSFLLLILNGMISAKIRVPCVV